MKPVVVMTGAAGGIGSAAAVQFAEAGYDVGLTDLAGPKLDAVAEAARTAGARVAVTPADLEDLDASRAMLRSLAEQLGALDVLVNNAAWRETLSLRVLSPESWDRTLRISLTTPAYLARDAAERMAQPAGKGGVILNVSSIYAVHSSGLASAYTAAKAGIEAVTRDLACAYSGRGVRAVALRLGAIDTEMSRDYTDGPEDPAAAAMAAQTYDQIPMGRWAQPREIAAAMVMLASSAASYITGAPVTIDGGFTAALMPQSIRRKLEGAEN